MHRLLFLAFLIFLPAQAHALSCLEPKLDQKAYDESALIFEGHVIKEKSHFQLGFDQTTKMKTYTFAIDRIWKGDTSLKKVDIEKDTYWGDGFRGGVQYLVVADEQDGEYYDPLCGNTRGVEYAHKQIEFLKSMKAGETK